MKTVLFPLIICFFLPLSLWGELKGPGIFTLTFSGDIMAHNNNFRMKNYDDIYQDVRELLLADDLSFGNLEFPVDETRPYATYPRFNVHKPYVEAAIGGGFQVFSMANNHSNDWFASAIKETLKNMESLKEKYGIWYKGTRASDQEPWEMEIIPLGSHKLGFISATALLNSFAAVELVHFFQYTPRRGELFSPQGEEFLKWIKEKRKEVDFLVLSLHDGVEYAAYPHRSQRAFYRRLIDEGVDILWAHHPHVLQPMEEIWLGEKKALILYSMGNFISGQTWFLHPQDRTSSWAFTGDSLLTQVTLLETSKGLGIRGVQGFPFVHYKSPKNEVVVRQVDQLLLEIPGGIWEGHFQARAEYMKNWRVPHSLGDLRLIQ